MAGANSPHETSLDMNQLQPPITAITMAAATTPQETSLDMNQLQPCITAITRAAATTSHETSLDMNQLQPCITATTMAAATTPHETYLDMNQLPRCITAITIKNPGISSCPWGESNCLSIHITMQMPSPVKNPSQHGKTFLNLNFQGLLAWYGSFSSSSPFTSVLFGASMFIGFAFSLAGVQLQNAFQKIALLFEKLGALSIAIGVSIIARFLVHPNLPWIGWLLFAFFLIPFIISFK